MNSKKLIGMGIALVVLAGIAALQNSGGKKRSPQTSKEGATLLQGLELNEIESVEIADDEANAMLEKKDGKWVVTSLFDYPADFGKLADALQDMAEVHMGEPVRSANVDAAEYGLDEAKRITLKNQGSAELTLEIGARREGARSAGWANQHFLRKSGSENIYLVDYDFRPFAAESEEWIDTELVNISSSDIVSVQVGDVELYSVSNTWKLADLDEETEEFQSSEADKLRRALQYLNCTTVADPALSDAELGFTNAVVYTASTTNKTYTVQVGGEADDGRYVRLSGDVPEALTNWTYIVRSYDVDDFIIPREKLVEEKEKPEAGEDENNEQ
ncbi:DUF4340 domain-containing protein [Pontiella agarivorans]|uniref:DUF4340 domain-containing protein n=1 Tax=Pontiella agarivorans TaxID=3038953 RepID=A0ABU5MZI8_9BACT|nr:DUF4340 domain-containing protein [Pontiella agarivorans]MDZ8119583.1 DUF4340 domain-containing protein [Pontiella agarivorans]